MCIAIAQTCDCRSSAVLATLWCFGSLPRCGLWFHHTPLPVYHLFFLEDPQCQTDDTCSAEGDDSADAASDKLPCLAVADCHVNRPDFVLSAPCQQLPSAIQSRAMPDENSMAVYGYQWQETFETQLEAPDVFGHCSM